MTTTKVLINSIEQVNEFVSKIAKFPFDMDLISGRYVIDAKSIMGIFSLRLSEPIELKIYAEGKEAEEVLESIKQFLA